MVRKLSDLAFWMGLSLYFGGLLTIGAVVAPALFSTARVTNLTMPGILTPPLDMPRQVGGELFGEVVQRFRVVEAIGLGLMLAGLAGWFLAHRHVRRSTWLLLILWASIAFVAGYDAAWLTPDVWKQREIVRQGAQARLSLPPNTPWPEQDRFDLLHTRSETLGRIKGYLLLAMLFVSCWRGVADRRTNTSSAPTRTGETPEPMRPAMSSEKPTR